MIKNRELILVINSGSSSVKYQLIDMQDETVVAKGLCERIGMDGKIAHLSGGKKFVFDTPLKNQKQALSELVRILTQGETASVSNISEIKAIGHRIAVGGEKSPNSVAIDEEILARIEETIDLAPLHLPAMIMGVKACAEVFSGTLQAAVFDTSFHLTMPKKAYIYPIPYEYYEKYGIRRFGYHGTSVRYVSRRLAKLMGRDLKELKVIACHIGNGSSVTAIRYGKSVDTSMGYTPLEGLIMGTRCGSIDPSIIFHMAKCKGLTLDEVSDVLNKQSGYLGVSGISSDDRDVQKAAEEGHQRAELATSILRYQIKKYIGAYAAAMNGVDAIIFTGGMGEKSHELREEVCSDMEFMGIELDKEKNITQNGKECEITQPNSKVKVWIIPTNEELMIARDTYHIYKEDAVE